MTEKKLPTEKESAQLNYCMELHFSACQALTHTIEILLNNHPYHQHAAEHDFKIHYQSILMSMTGALAELKKDAPETVFEKGRLCKKIEPSEYAPDGLIGL
jgi:hypothetical protein